MISRGALHHEQRHRLRPLHVRRARGLLLRLRWAPGRGRCVELDLDQRAGLKPFAAAVGAGSEELGHPLQRSFGSAVSPTDPELCGTSLAKTHVGRSRSTRSQKAIDPHSQIYISNMQIEIEIGRKAQGESQTQHLEKVQDQLFESKQGLQFWLGLFSMAFWPRPKSMSWRA